MARSYYSMVLPHSADEVWTTIRPFNHYAWSGVPGTTIIEADKAGDQVGAIRRIALHDGTIRRQLLLALRPARACQLFATFSPYRGEREG